MFGDNANKLVVEARRAVQLKELPLHQHSLVKEIVDEIALLNKDVEYLNDEQAVDPADNRVHQCQLFVTHLCLRRNKRCLLAYQKLRADKIAEFLWLNVDPIETGANAPNGGAGAAGGLGRAGFAPGGLGATAGGSGGMRLALANLSNPEHEYYKQYQDLVLDFKSEFSDIDLCGDLVPPTDILIDVRVLKNGGEVQTEYGVFNLIKDSQFYVRKLDVDRLIQQGYLEEI
ncbi:GINS complex, Psf1 component [Metschnikowia bicuspidata]|uniref:DNA replication complex GINS protein PSF1 n=1 Tax=Metschnikowia bicuspidata TaxID=27322 RepID=A0A4P9ZCB1_9ASCO|nr:GINS complex, Psf1 component [Metschnikowia bicuspidata]